MLFYIKKILSYIRIFFIKGSLSDRDIKKLLGKQIYIYPFKEENLKGGSYNLTASKYAIIEEYECDKKVSKLIVDGENIVIPAGKTGIVETKESIYVSRWITGTYHSRVSMVNKGLGHIGTTLDPDYFGISAIALHNTTNEDITIKVGDSIATVMFSCLRSISTGNHDNMSGHMNKIHLDVEDFYENNKNKNSKEQILVFKDIKIEENISIMDLLLGKVNIIKRNKDIRKSSMVIYDITEPVCENCKTCKNNEKCSYKVLKNIKAEEYKRKKTIEDIGKWRNSPWIISKKRLKKLVEEEVKIRDTVKDIIIWGIIWLAIGAGIIFLIYQKIISGEYDAIKDSLNSLLTGIPSAIVIVIGWIISYKTYCKKEFEKKASKKLDNKEN